MVQDDSKLLIPSEARLIQCGPCHIIWLEPQHKIIAPETLLTKDEREYARTYKAQARRLEYVRTRWLIRKSLSYGGPLPRDTSGMPTWPNGWLGSISHKMGHCGVVLERETNYASVGLDIENISKVHEKLENKILNLEEATFLHTLATSNDFPFASILAIAFSFKEALFKAHFPLGRKMFYFHDASISSLDMKKKTIAARVHLDTSTSTLEGSITNGAFRFIDTDCQLVASIAIVPKDHNR